MQHQFRSDHDHRSAGIIDALAKQVLAETALFALEHVAERFQRPFVGAGNGAAPPSVVEKGVDGFLKHPFFVTNNDLGRAQLDQSLQAVVAVDHAAVKVVQVRSCETAPVQGNQRA